VTKTKCKWATALAAVIAAAASAGCTSGHKPSAADKAGGSSVPTVLRLASVDWSGHHNAPLLRQFADQVAKLSDGRLQVRVVFNVGWPAADHEQQIVRDVRSGRYDLGWIGAAAGTS